MKRLFALLVAAVLSVTPVFAAKSFYEDKIGDWALFGILGSDAEGELADTSCYTLVERGTMRLLLGYDIITDELFVLMNNTAWNIAIAPNPPQPEVPGDETTNVPMGFVKFNGTDTTGQVIMKVNAKDRVSIRYIDPSSFLSALVSSTSITVWNESVPATTIDLTGVLDAVKLLNECVIQGQQIVGNPEVPKISA